MASRTYDGAAVLFNATAVASASIEELRSMLDEVTKAYREAKTSTAHQYLQYNLLAMERSEQMNRMEVELEMKNKEVEVLQDQAKRGASAFPTPVMASARLVPMSPSDQQLANTRNRCNALEIQNEELRWHYEDLKALMAENQASYAEENRRLRERIRENRKHLNMLRQANGIDSSPFSAFATPQAPVRHRPEHFVTPKARGEDAFSQLLLADQVLSQEANTTPSTPAPGQNRRGAFHQRAAHSLSSLPTTPAQARSVPASARMQEPLYTPRQPQTPHVPQTAPQQQYRQSRRVSRDSTISACDDDEAYSSSSSRSDKDDIPESQASQEARNMLRQSTSFGKSGSAKSSQRSEAVAKSSGLLQTKLYGPIKKVAPMSTGAAKRKAADEVSPLSTKKARSGDAVGLGIGSWAS